MAAPDHLLYTPQQAANSTLAAVRYQSTLARIVSQDFSSEFVPGRGSMVTIKRPIMIDPAKVYTSENRKAEKSIEYSNLVEPYVSVKLTDQVYNAVKLPDDFQTFTLQDIEQQVVAPMAQSVADHLNTVVADAFKKIADGLSKVDTAAKGKLVGANGTAYDSISALRDAGTTFVGFGAGVTGKGALKAERLTAKTNKDVLKAIRAAHQLLGLRGVPTMNRYLVVGSGWEAALMSQDILNKVNQAGTDGLLRQATLGNLYGFTVVVDYTIDPLKAYAFQRDGVALLTRTTAIPRGVAFAQTVAKDGFTLRYLQDYDPDHLTDRAVIDTFAGAELVDPQRIVALTGTDGFEEPVEAPAGTRGNIDAS
ncbi:P22 phage major capsid protein family protein [Corynebacterium resistens]|uniref:P22 phage major capsid protein family protein n=1 Tax=Corynebacterium resistens TaxID=258224 RepID=UPI00235750D2|nr:P22 phage major capsid protein family protein [Corynebacterium resistens]